MKQKRGNADAQFHWLFVLMAGGFILFLFAIFISQGIAANEQKQTALMLRYFDSVFTSAQNLKNLDEQIESLPSITIEQLCEPDVESKLRFVGQSLDKKTTYLPIFSARYVSGDSYPLKTLPYAMPFLVDNPIFLTDSQTLFIVYSDEEVIQERYARLLPAYANVVKTSDFSLVKDEGYKNVVIITSNLGGSIFSTGQLDPLTDLPTIPLALRKANLRHVYVDADFLNVYYYKKEIVNGDVTLSALPDSVTYNDDASLLGAIITDSPDIYTCNMMKLDKRSRAVALQIALRAQSLLSSTDPYSRCVQSYESIQQEMYGFLDETILFDDNARLKFIEAVSIANEQVIMYSCPTLY